MDVLQSHAVPDPNRHAIYVVILMYIPLEVLNVKPLFLESCLSVNVYHLTVMTQESFNNN